MLVVYNFMVHFLSAIRRNSAVLTVVLSNSALVIVLLTRLHMLRWVLLAVIGRLAEGRSYSMNDTLSFWFVLLGLLEVEDYRWAVASAVVGSVVLGFVGAEGSYELLFFQCVLFHDNIQIILMIKFIEKLSFMYDNMIVIKMQLLNLLVSYFS